MDAVLGQTNAYLERGETFYAQLKTRLALESFTGNGAEAMRQESILTDAAQTQLDAKQAAIPAAEKHVRPNAPRFPWTKGKALFLKCLPLCPSLQWQ